MSHSPVGESSDSTRRTWAAIESNWSREHRRVAVRLPERPRHPHRGVAPDRGAVRGRELRSDGRRTSGRPGRRTAPCRRRACCSSGEIDAASRGGSRRRRTGRPRSGANDREVAGPAEPLVALRAVGRHVEEVAAQPQTTLRCSWLSSSSEHSKCADPPQVGVRRRRPSGRRRSSSPGPAVDLDVAEAVEGEGRLEDVVAAAQDEPVGRLGACAAGGFPARRARAPRRAGG